ncbi:MAG: ABC transporter permease [Planctomycetota bacterium]|jgi:ABC-type antimicrobial peptide transport system permease subunit|nr:ABC transporter permease [Planctomycetota bacterium]
MMFRMLAKVGLNALLANKLRTFLAVLGIIIGVAAVISMLALGAGTRDSILRRVSSMGADLLIVRPGQAGRRGIMSGTAQTMTTDDALAVAAEIPGVRLVSPVVSGGQQLKYYNKNTFTQVYGVASSYLAIRNFEIAHGRNFNDFETERLARVAVLGPTTAENLFGKDEPVGETVKIKGVNYLVIGVLKGKGDQGWSDPDDQALVPFSTAMKQILGVNRIREIDVLSDGAEGGNARVAAAIEALLRDRHRIPANAENDFNVRDQSEIIDMAASFGTTLTILLGSLGGISLLVGGIGIMNIMLVTVAERTREIGLRKAIGARERDILTQFLFESILVSGCGGALGVLLGVGVALAIPALARLGGSDFSTLVEADSILLALGVSVGVGVFFGYYPAKRAARLDPVEALRYE